MIKQLIFDCDGVLVDSEIIAAEVMVEELNNYGIPISMNDYLTHCTGKTFFGLKKTLSSQHNIDFPDDFVQIIINKLKLSTKQGLQSVEGVLSLLDNIRTIPKAVVSNSELYHIDDLLTQVNARHHFGENIFSSEQVHNPKPSPDIYLYGAEMLGMNPENCLVIEDSVSGATAAVAAGMRTIGFLAGRHIVQGHEDRLKKVGVETVAHSAKELETIIKKSVKD